MCGGKISIGDPIHPQGGHPTRYWVCEACQANEPDRPIDHTFLMRKIRFRLESPLVNRLSSPYTPRVPEAALLGQVGEQLYLCTDADRDLRDDLKAWATEGRPRALSRLKTRRLLEWLEQFDECTGVSPVDPDPEFVDQHARDSRWKH